jgi:predicted AAA+ superfamily ATPase
VVLSGLRRVGKSVALQQVARRVAAGGRHVLYFDFSDPRAAGLGVEDLLAATGFLDGPAGHRVLLLDEVARDARWLDSIKRLVDLGRGAPGVVVADSAAASLRAGDGGETAVGRRVDIVLEPLSFQELARFRRLSYRDRADADGLALATLADDYLTRGGLPEVALSTSPDVDGLLDLVRQDCERMVLQDIPRIREVRDVEALRRTWLAVARAASAAVNVADVARSLEVSRPTVTGMLGLLREGRLTRELPCDGGPRAVVHHPAKYVVADPSMAAAHVTRRERESDAARGRLVEVAVHRHLDELRTNNPGACLSYVRMATSGKQGELDFLLSHPDAGRIAVEAKYAAQTPDPRLLARLSAQARALGERRAVLVSRCPTEQSHREGDGVTVHACPLWRFLHDTGDVVSGGTA